MGQLSNSALGNFVLGGLGGLPIDLSKKLIILESSPVIEMNIEYNDNLEANECELKLPINFDINTNTEVQVLNQQLKVIFEGVVISNQGRDYSFREVRIYSYEKLLQNRIVDDIFTNVSPIQLIETIVTTYSDMTFSSTYETDIVIPRIFSKNKTAWDLIFDIFEGLGDATYRIVGKEFRVFKRQSIPAPVSLNNTRNCLIQGGWDEETEEQVTSLTLIGEKFDEGREQSFVGDGTTATFTLQFIPKSIRIVVNGVEQKLAVEGQSEGDYFIVKRSKDITFLPTSIPANGADIDVEYIFEENIKLTQDADFDIIQEFGLIEKSITRKFLSSFDQALDYAIEYIEKHQLPTQYAEFQFIDNFDITQWFPGQRVRVIDDFNRIRGETINSRFAITSIKYRFPETGIIIGVGEIPQKMSYFLKEQQYNLRQLYEEDDNSEILQIAQTFKNNVELISNSIIEHREIDYTDVGFRVFIVGEGVVGTNLVGDGSIFSMIWGVQRFGTWGVNWWGSTGTVERLLYIRPNNNIFVELFNFDDYISETSTGTYSAGTYTLQDGQQLQSTVIYKIDAPITNISFVNFDFTNLILEVSNTTGQWTTITTSNHTFTNLNADNELRYRITANGGVVELNRIEIRINL